MAQGLLTGKFEPDHRFAKGDHRAKNKLFQPPHNARVPKALAQLRPIAQRKGITLGQLALAWVIARPKTCAIAGARNAGQVLENARAAEVVLDADDMKAMDRIGDIVTAHLESGPAMWDF
jgi:aryl-alcohol dehydrogenase-like predicted oxidoreductase